MVQDLHAAERELSEKRLVQLEAQLEREQEGAREPMRGELDNFMSQALQPRRHSHPWAPTHSALFGRWRDSGRSSRQSAQPGRVQKRLSRTHRQRRRQPRRSIAHNTTRCHVCPA